MVSEANHAANAHGNGVNHLLLVVYLHLKTGTFALIVE